MTTHSAIHLHGFFRSSASWRVRIALALKGLSYSQHTYKLRAQEQRSASYLAMNPQGLVPTLEMDGAVLTQSLAIIEYLDETHPAPPLIGTPNIVSTADCRGSCRLTPRFVATQTSPDRSRCRLRTQLSGRLTGSAGRLRIRRTRPEAASTT